MLGTSAVTLQPLGGWDHVVQSIRDILATPLGSRVLRRDYGSTIPGLLDRPMNEITLLDFVVGVAAALDRWEPRVKVEHVRFAEVSSAGRAALDIDVVYLDDGSSRTARVTL